MPSTNEYSLFKKIIMSIKDLEKYTELAAQTAKSTIMYILKIIAIFTIIVSIIVTYKSIEQINKFINQIDENVFEISFKENQMIVNENKEVIIGNEANLINLIINTEELESEKIDEYIEKLEKSSNNSILILRDRFYIKSNVSNGVIQYSYKDVSKGFEITELTKQDIINYLSGTNKIVIYIGVFLLSYIYLFIAYLTSLLMDILVLAIFAYLTSILLRVRLRFSAICNIATYALTLPVILNLIYILINSLTGFEMKYFSIMYIGVACIYVVSSILLIKSDIIKRGQELAKVIEEQEKVKKELEEEQRRKEEEKREEERKKKQEEGNENKENEKEKTTGEEPQGENA